MAVKVERKVVCDLGERHGGEIRQWRLTVDKESKVFDLCPSCAKPLQKLWDTDGFPSKPATRMKVYSMSEIESQKKAPE
jgi:hypothetical protein